MLLNQLKPLVNSGIKEFGGYPVVITSDRRLPEAATATITNIKRQCPTGLDKLTVVEMNHKYKVKYTFGCGGDAEHEVEKRNGVLVQMDWSDKFVGENESVEEAVSRINGLDLHEVVYDDDPETSDPSGVQVVVSHKVLVVPWGEYALVEAEREKARNEQAERNEALRSLATKLGVTEKKSSKRGREISGWDWSEDFHYARAKKAAKDFEDEDEQLAWDRETLEREQKEQSADYAFPSERWSSTGTVMLWGRVTLSMEQARTVGKGLDLLRDALGSGQLAGTIVGGEIEEFLKGFDN